MSGENNQAKAASTALSMVLLLVGIKALAFVREMIVAAYFGATEVTDAFYAANRLPTMLFALASAGLTAVFVPTYTQMRRNRGEDAALRFVNQILNVSLIAFSAIAGICMLFAENMILLLAPRFDPYTAQMAAHALRVVMPMLPLQVMMGIMVNLLIARERFTLSQLYGMPMSLSIILFTAVFSQRWQINALAYGTLAGAFLQYVVMRMCAGEMYSWKPMLSLRDHTLKGLLPMVGPALFSGAVLEINALIDSRLASGFGGGAMTEIELANRLVSFAFGIIVVTLVTIAYQRFAQDVSEGEFGRLSIRLSRLTKIFGCVLLPVVCLTGVLAQPIVSFSYEREAFTQTASRHTAQMLLCYAPMIWGLGIRDLYSRAFFACGDTMRPTLVNVGSAVLNWALSILLMRRIGAAGIVLGTTISILISAGVMMLIWRRAVKEQPKLDAREYLRLLCGAAVCAIVGAFAYMRAIHLTPLRQMLWVAPAALGAYAGALWLMKSESFRDVCGIGYAMVKRFVKSKMEK